MNWNIERIRICLENIEKIYKKFERTESEQDEELWELLKKFMNEYIASKELENNIENEEELEKNTEEYKNFVKTVQNEEIKNYSNDDFLYVPVFLESVFNKVDNLKNIEEVKAQDTTKYLELVENIKQHISEEKNRSKQGNVIKIEPKPAREEQKNSDPELNIFGKKQEITKEQQNERMLTPKQTDDKKDKNVEIDISSDFMKSINKSVKVDMSNGFVDQLLKNVEQYNLGNKNSKQQNGEFDARITDRNINTASKALEMFDLDKIDMYYRTEIFDPEQLNGKDYVEVGFSTMLVRLFETETLSVKAKIQKLNEFSEQFSEEVKNNKEKEEARQELLKTLNSMKQSLAKQCKLDENELYMYGLFCSCEMPRIENGMSEQAKETVNHLINVKAFCHEFLFGAKDKEITKEQKERKSLLKKFVSQVLPKEIQTLRDEKEYTKSEQLNIRNNIVMRSEGINIQQVIPVQA